MNKTFLFILSSLFLVLTVSCSSDYRSAIPAGSTALISVDAKAINADALKSLLGTEDMEASGIDASERLILFESADGNMGLCAKVNDNDALSELLSKLATTGKTQKISQRNDCTFYRLSDSWVIGYSSTSMLIMGPVVVAQQPQMVQKMATYLSQGEEQGMLSSPLMKQLESHESSIAMVAQAQALPETLAAIFSLGAPKDADASQVIIDADINNTGTAITIEGHPMSFNKQINSEIEKNISSLRPISQGYLTAASRNSLVSLFLNAEGGTLLKMLQQNKGLQMLLAGINQAIDLNAIISSIDGDMLISVPSYANDKMSISMAAKLSNSYWLKDVSYWKTSVPEGGKINDWQKDAYQYTDGTMSFFFGATSDNQFYSGSSPQEATASIAPAEEQHKAEVLKLAEGKRIALIISLSSLLKDSDAALALPLLGNASTIVYTVK